MARKNYPDEFKWVRWRSYRDTAGATITKSQVSWVSAWCTAADVPVRNRRAASTSEPAPGPETAEQELSRLRTENQALRADKTRLSTERDILRRPGISPGR